MADKMSAAIDPAYWFRTVACHRRCRAAHGCGRAHHQHLVDGIFAPWRSWHRQHASTKAALNAIARQGAVDLAERGIRVNTILPELIRTRALRQRAVFSVRSSPEHRAAA
jgi:NAD(P)-dependent dehydrogenase (short-subunit alcohol dehydrogenase family)